MRLLHLLLLATLPLVLNGVEVVAGFTAFTSIVSSLSSFIPGSTVLKSVLGSFSLLGDMAGNIDGVFSADPNAEVLNAISSLGTKMDEYYRGMTNKIDNLQYEMVKLSFTTEVTEPVGVLDEMMRDVLSQPKSAKLRNLFLAATKKYDLYDIALKISVKLKDSSTSLLNAVIRKDSMYKGTETEFNSIVSYVKTLLNKLVIIHAFDYGLRGQNRQVTKIFKNNTFFQGKSKPQMNAWYMEQFVKNYPDHVFNKTVEISKFMDTFLATYKDTNSYWSDGTLDSLVTQSITDNIGTSIEKQADIIKNHLTKIYTNDQLYIVVSLDTPCTRGKNPENVYLKVISSSVVVAVFRSPKTFERTAAQNAEMQAVMGNIGEGDITNFVQCKINQDSALIKYFVLFVNKSLTDFAKHRSVIVRTLANDDGAVWYKDVPNRKFYQGRLTLDRPAFGVAIVV